MTGSLKAHPFAKKVNSMASPCGRTTNLYTNNVVPQYVKMKYVHNKKTF